MVITTSGASRPSGRPDGGSAVDGDVSPDAGPHAHDGGATLAAPGPGRGASLARAAVTPLWFTVTAVLVAAAAAMPLLSDHRFYFVDDTQSGAYGIWYRLGAILRSGDFPGLLNPRTWQAGNIAAEGQWGLWNPLVLAIGWFVAGVGNAVVAVSAVKIVLLTIAGTGVFVLVRTYRVAPAWCAVAGVAATLTGFTSYIDAPSWVTGLMTWAILPWFWAALRRVVLRGANPLPALVAGYLEVTVGYLNGTLALIAVLLGVGVTLIAQRRWRSLAPLVGVGVFCGLLALTIYLPGVLTQSVTTRSSDKITNSQLLNADLTDLATSAIATARPTVLGFWGAVVGAPLLYITWALPLAALIDVSRARRGTVHVLDQLVVGALTAAFVFGPSEMGALRFPDRMIPFVATTAVVLLVIGLARARARATLGRLAGALGLLLASFYLTWASYPQQSGVYLHATLIAAAGVVVVWVLLATGRRWLGRLTTGVVVVALLAFSLGLAVLAHHDAPTSPLADFGAPEQVSDYQTQLAGAQGDTLVVGDQVGSAVVKRTPEVWKESLLANTWFLNSHSVMGTYSPVGFQTYNDATCTNWRGETCHDLFRRLFTVQRPTGLLLIDQLSVSTVQFYRDVDTKANFDRPLPGWHVLRSERFTVTWVRDKPLPAAGGVVWTSPSTEVTTLGRTDRSVRLRVDAVPAAGGRVAFSRLAWPGYTVTGGGAGLGPKVSKYLLSVDVPASAAGQVVTVRFSPPGWRLEVACAVVAGGAGLLWSMVVALVALVRWRRRRRRLAEASLADHGDIGVMSTS